MPLLRQLLLFSTAILVVACSRTRTADDTSSRADVPGRPPVLVYASNADSFTHWRPYSKGDHEGESKAGRSRFDREPAMNESPALVRFRSVQGGIVGANLATPLRAGRVAFEYRLVESSPPEKFVVFAIPMQKSGDVEVGTTVFDDPKNGFSPLRQRFVAPKAHYKDGRWHSGAVDFDFRSLEGTASTTVGLRLNEGIATPGKVTVEVRNVKVYALPATEARGRGDSQK